MKRWRFVVAGLAFFVWLAWFALCVRSARRRRALWRQAFDAAKADGSLDQLLTALSTGGADSPLDAVQVVADVEAFFSAKGESRA